MSFAADITGVKVQPLNSTIQSTWSEIGVADLCAWNDVLFRSGASIYQYPFWNEPYRHLGVTPRYVLWGTPHRPKALAAVLTVGFGPAKIGLVFRGPIQLTPELGFSRSMLNELLAWARSQGYMFLRFTHSDPEILSGLAAASDRALDSDEFPYMQDYPIVSGDYIVEQSDGDEETLDSFDREARRKIRRADEAGYEFRSTDSLEELAAVWPLYEQCARRKKFRVERPLSFFLDLMRGARLNHLARLYNVHLKGNVVGSTLVFRDRTTAHCQIAAFEPEHRQSSTFLHWHAMRDMYRMGARRYNLGPGPGSLVRFKSMFCTPAQYPGPLTVVLKENWFQMWKKGFIPIARRFRPIVRKLALKRSALSHYVAGNRD
jgi:hypothetical protein